MLFSALILHSLLLTLYCSSVTASKTLVYYARFMATWSPSSWQSKPAGQQPTCLRIGRWWSRRSSSWPLYRRWSPHGRSNGCGFNLRRPQKENDSFSQGGACAERFDQCSAEIITNKLKILLQMSLLLTFGLKRRVTRVGRFAGQYAKPRSADTEERDGVTLPTYRGEIINGPDFTAADRVPDPERMLRGYEHAALTLNFIRSLVDGGVCRPPPHRILGPRVCCTTLLVHGNTRRW